MKLSESWLNDDSRFQSYFQAIENRDLETFRSRSFRAVAPVRWAEIYKD